MLWFQAASRVGRGSVTVLLQTGACECQVSQRHFQMKARAHPGTLLKGVKWLDGTEMFKSGLC